MAQKFEALSDRHIEFIREQKIFFVGTAASEGSVNVSPKGMDSFRIIDKNRALWLNVTGSGNESAAHVQLNPRMTVMFCAFTGSPVILRLYGTARVIHPGDAEWSELFPVFDPIPGARQIFDLSIDLVQTSCGMAVPYLDYKSDRNLLRDWATKRGEDGLREYWKEKNQTSLDGFPSNILSKAPQRP